jgi:hypothetical protein
MKDEIIAEVFENLKLNTGITATWTLPNKEAEGKTTLQLKRKNIKFYFEVKKEVRQYQLPEIIKRARDRKPFILIAENIFPTIKEQLRKENIGYIDGAGNIYINNDPTYIWIDGHKAVKKNKRVTNRAFTKTGLKVVFHLLLRPQDINLPHRQLAERTGVAVGNIQNVLEGLNETGFILQKTKQEKILNNKKALLARWIDGYRETLKPFLHIGNYNFANKNDFQNWEKLQMPADAKAQWGGEGAAEQMTEYLKAQELTLYIESGKTPFLLAWKLIPGANGKLQLYKKFWYTDSADDIVTPALLVYTDLLITDDPRCIETAEILYDQQLKQHYGIN